MANLGNDLLEAKSQQLKHPLAEAGYHTVSTISIYHNYWHGEFNITERCLKELQLHEFWADKPFVVLEALGSLHTLRLNADDLTIYHDEIGQMLQASLQLQELIISLQDIRMLESIEKTVEMWQGRSSPLQLTLLEYGSDDRGHIVTQIVVNSHVSSHPRNSHPDLQGSNASFAMAEFLQWNSDCVWVPLTTLTATLLDSATKQHPSVLTYFTMDISNLSQDEGLPHLQNILQQSMLGHFHIYSKFDYTYFEPISSSIDSTVDPTKTPMVLSQPQYSPQSNTMTMKVKNVFEKLTYEEEARLSKHLEDPYERKLTISEYVYKRCEDVRQPMRDEEGPENEDEDEDEKDASLIPPEDRFPNTTIKTNINTNNNNQANLVNGRHYGGSHLPASMTPGGQKAKMVRKAMGLEAELPFGCEVRATHDSLGHAKAELDLLMVERPVGLRTGLV
ncbi:hypothetical protein CPB97_000772 [Podila verticillata]|nr:hypothetical protein CPB97_000772 [Podila verticillata]